MKKGIIILLSVLLLIFLVFGFSGLLLKNNSKSNNNKSNTEEVIDNKPNEITTLSDEEKALELLATQFNEPQDNFKFIEKTEDEKFIFTKKDSSSVQYIVDLENELIDTKISGSTKGASLQ